MKPSAIGFKFEVVIKQKAKFNIVSLQVFSKHQLNDLNQKVI